MEFIVEVISAAWARSGGRCECQRRTHDHDERCPNVLDYEARGEETPKGWEAHHIDPNGLGTLLNCEILCRPCLKAIRSHV